ncbi:GNAT family N-acetyltransferase [Lignipirellula cremea]|uniref:BioF2-like acetyltransferase domain-containing protein n=1 Tax=Lignipirellula cremea TaxID=2528010 RepID=A0A518DWZ9_9BACT|nr:GNAT family N-acetyltransferase [Lignipirellula cremea]QDU96357.1 hypothetical protein Pla8534_41770 [Lignipirellula cremea]
MWDVLEINEMADLEPYRPAWRKLLEKTPQASFFQSLDWLECYWRHFQKDQRLRVLIVGPPERPIGIVPLVERTEIRKIGKIRVLTYPLDDWGSFYGPISNQPLEALYAALLHVKKTRQSWDMVDLRWHPEEGCDTAETDRLMQLADMHPRRSQRAETCLIDLIGDWNAYLSLRNSKWRNNLQRWLRRAHEAGEVRLERYRPLGSAASDGEPCWNLLDECQRLAAVSWQGSSTTGTTISHHTITDFIRDTHQAAAAGGFLDLNLLRLNEQPIAFAYNYHFQGQVYGMRVGFDPEFTRLTPGNVLYALAIEDCYARGDVRYDLGAGSLEIKRYFQSRIAPIYQSTHYRSRAVKGQILRLRANLVDWWQEKNPAPAE